MFCVQIRHGRGAWFKVERIQVEMSGFRKAKLLVTGTIRATGGVIKVEVEEVSEGDEGWAIAVEEVIVLDEGTRGVVLEEV